MERLTQEELAEIQHRAEAATPGPWFVTTNGDSLLTVASDSIKKRIVDIPEEKREADGDVWNVYASVYSQKGKDAEFIAQSRSDVPKLLAEIEWLRKEISFIAHVDLVGHPYDTEHIAVSVKSWALNVLDGVGHDD